MGQQFSFNPMAYDPQVALEKIPRGWYRAIGSKAEVRETEKKDGLGLEVHWKVIDGVHKDRVVKKWYNITNPSAQAVAIAAREITSFCGAMNKWTPVADTDEILNVPLQILLADKEGSDNYNDVKGYKTIDGNDPVKPGSTGAVAVAPSIAAAAPAAQYAQPAAPPPPAAPRPSDSWQRSPDGMYMLDPAQNAWVPNIPPTPAAPPAAPAPPAPPAPPAAPPAAYTPPQTYAQPGAAPGGYPAAAPAPAAPPPPAQQQWQPGAAPAAPVWRP